MHTPGTIDNKVQPLAAESFSIHSEILPAEIDYFLHQETRSNNPCKHLML